MGKILKMKKLFLLVALLLSGLTFAQEEVKEKAVTTFNDIVKEWVQKALPAIESGAEFVIEETPIVIRQYLMFEAVYYGLIVLLGLLFLNPIRKILCNLVLKKSDTDPKTDREKSHIVYLEVSPKKWLRTDGDADDHVTFEQVAHTILKIGSYIAGSVIILVNIITFIKAAFFPKLYLVEKFIELI